MTVDIENFIEGQYRRYFPDGIEPNQDYIELYRDFADEKLRLLFSSMHADSVFLFERMNSRLPTGEETAYYWAEESRGVIKLIDTATTLLNELRDTELSFYIDDYYAGKIDLGDQWKCRPFVPAVIPEPMPSAGKWRNYAGRNRRKQITPAWGDGISCDCCLSQTGYAIPKKDQQRRLSVLLI